MIISGKLDESFVIRYHITYSSIYYSTDDFEFIINKNFYDDDDDATGQKHNNLVNKEASRIFTVHICLDRNSDYSYQTTANDY